MYTFSSYLDVELRNMVIIVFILERWLGFLLQSWWIAMFHGWLRLRMKKCAICTFETWEAAFDSGFIAFAVRAKLAFQNCRSGSIFKLLSSFVWKILDWIIGVSHLFISTIQRNPFIFLMLWLITRIESLGCTQITLAWELSFRVHSVEVALETMGYLWKIITRFVQFVSKNIWNSFLCFFIEWEIHFFCLSRPYVSWWTQTKSRRLSIWHHWSSWVWIKLWILATKSSLWRISLSKFVL